MDAVGCEIVGGELEEPVSGIVISRSMLHSLPAEIGPSHVVVPVVSKSTIATLVLPEYISSLASDGPVKGVFTLIAT